MTWCFVYPKNALFNLPFFEKRFHDKMYDTVAQDERIVSSLYPFDVHYDVNVKADEYQRQVLKKLGF